MLYNGKIISSMSAADVTLAKMVLGQELSDAKNTLDNLKKTHQQNTPAYAAATKNYEKLLGINVRLSIRMADFDNVSLSNLTYRDVS